MTRLFTTSSLMLLAAAGLATPAMADVQVVGTVDVNKDIDITVDTNKDKNVDVDVDFDSQLDGSAQSNAIINATVDDVTVGAYDESITDQDIDKTVSTIDSVNANTGIVQFNQDAGNVANQVSTAA